VKLSTSLALRTGGFAISLAFFLEALVLLDLLAFAFIVIRPFQKTTGKAQKPLSLPRLGEAGQLPEKSIYFAV